MSSNTVKYHIFEEKNFQGLVYCDYCGKLLWGLTRQGVQCTECGYSCHVHCSDMVIQCRIPRRLSPDSLSVTDSEAESVVSKYSQRNSLERFNSTSSIEDSRSRKKSIEEPVKSPIFSNTTKELSRTLKIESYRKSLKQRLQKNNNSDMIEISPHSTAKVFTRFVARSRAFFWIGQWWYDIYNWKNKWHSFIVCIIWVCSCLYPYTILLIPPLLVWRLYWSIGLEEQQNVSQILFPRYEEHSSEYYTNLQNMHYTFVFLIRLYDNLSYHMQHIQLTSTSYKLMLLISLLISVMLAFAGRFLVITVGLVILLNKTWIGTAIEIILCNLIELVQKVCYLYQVSRGTKSVMSERKWIEVSVYENQRWWAGTGYTSQLLRSERSAWSNICGSEPLLPKDEMLPPKNYTWEENGWQLDITGPWTDDALGIVVNYM
ncbi:uncharacterized protein BX663DRAFT_508218 [Cokeromyces recurvatus]|uniref:uncharacterized protein n=1 Tax=Cokeromyces recurvatus TaxID=90255 RepID=UPI00221F3C35|nr:uncharacterized protein BX663DRAFT_508218 [Cokeromyces recurvatus]KAI7903322.1 hypothetical protein BX663DRAFT_508218 [Cokeromyces recurvatus]